ncbi:MAG: 2TM domain-containing protein [Candidatus Hodarchaeota archaeon]
MTSEEKIPKEKTTTRNVDEIRETWFSKFLAAKLTLIIHIFAYVSVNGLCYMLNLMFWHGRLWAWHVSLGWGIGLSIHLGLYYIFTSGMKSISKAIFLIHLIAYTTVNVYLTLINFVYMANWPGVIWSHIPALLWGFGVLMNLILNNMIAGKGLTATEIRKNVTGILLLTHIGYYGMVNALLYALGKYATVYHLAIGTLLYWGCGLLAHTAITILYNYVSISDAKKGVVSHAIIYGLSGVINIVDITFFSEGMLFYTSRVNGFLISAGIWALALLAHGLLAIRWDQTNGDVKDLMKWLLIMHLAVYIASIAYMLFLNFNIWEGRFWVPTVALGWVIGLGVHGLLYNFIRDEEKDGLKITVYLHIIAYICAMVLMVWLNLAMWQGRFWVPTVAIGWGVGLCEHILIYILYQKNLFTSNSGLRASVYMHLAAYLVIASLLIWLNLSIWEGRLWFPFALIGWGIGLGSHIIVDQFVTKR